MAIKILWRPLKKDDPAWSFSKCLYAYISEDCKEIYYIGKTWGTTVKKRWNWSGKEDVWSALAQDGIRKHVPLIGEIQLNKGERLTKELLADIESLLIHREKPLYNIQSINTRTKARPGMRLYCDGFWPSYQKQYADK